MIQQQCTKYSEVLVLKYRKKSKTRAENYNSRKTDDIYQEKSVSEFILIGQIKEVTHKISHNQDSKCANICVLKWRLQEAENSHGL